MLERQTADPYARDNFHISGPLHLNSVDWSLAEHRRSVVASLVRGVSVLERCGKHGLSEHLAPAWWEFFHFRLADTLIDPDDSSIFGSVFEYDLFEDRRPSARTAPPRYVIAFRGTIMRRRTCTSDIKLDIRVILSRLCMSSRYQVALRTVEQMVANFGCQSIWLAGHSLGSAIALQVGKDMAKEEKFLEAYLFNPPFPSTPLERFRSQRLKVGIRYARSLITARLVAALKGNNDAQDDDGTSDRCGSDSVALSSWAPCLFVNPSDPLCSEYIGYFEHREKMEARGEARIERVASQNSLVSLVSWAIGKGVEPTHFIPSARLIVNRGCEEQGFKQVHDVHQWWKDHQSFEYKLYQLS